MSFISVLDSFTLQNFGIFFQHTETDTISPARALTLWGHQMGANIAIFAVRVHRIFTYHEPDQLVEFRCNMCSIE